MLNLGKSGVFGRFVGCTTGMWILIKDQIDLAELNMYWSLSRMCKIQIQIILAGGALEGILEVICCNFLTALEICIGKIIHTKSRL